MSPRRALSVLSAGELVVVGIVPWSSNAALLAEVTLQGVSLPAVYKPRRGERPLHDFPSGSLCLRETAAFVLSEALGWHLVPPTTLRDGPLGPGAVQLYIPHDADLHYLNLPHPDRAAIQRIAALDIVANNADRKSGHVISDASGRVWAIDHGLTFHTVWKLRTVIWDYAGDSLPPDIRRDLEELKSDLGDGDSAIVRALSGLLTATEMHALEARTAELVRLERFPRPDRDRRVVPWPLV